MDCGTNPELYGLVVAVGLLFGIGYNHLVAMAERHGWLEGYVWLAVAIGIATSLGLVAIMSWQAAVMALVVFTATGVPMALGSICRYARQRERAQLAIIREVDDDQA